MTYLKIKMNFNYNDTIKTIPRFILSIIILIIMLCIFNKILPIENSNRITSIINLIISGIFCGGTYLMINYKQVIVLLPPKLLKKLKISNEESNI